MNDNFDYFRYIQFYINTPKDSPHKPGDINCFTTLWKECLIQRCSIRTGIRSMFQ